MVLTRLGWLAVAALAVLPFACYIEETDDKDEVEQVCAPGSTQLCHGPGACEGAQICNQQGTGYLACDCGAGGSGATAGTGGEGGTVPTGGGGSGGEGGATGGAGGAAGGQAGGGG